MRSLPLYFFLFLVFYDRRPFTSPAPDPPLAPTHSSYALSVLSALFQRLSLG